jgi:hypothetical protein
MSQKYYIKGGTFSKRPSIDGSSLYLNETVANIVTDMGFPNFSVGCCNLSTKPVNGSTLSWNSTTEKWEAVAGSGGVVLTNLGYTPSATNGIITNTNGSTATIPLVTSTLAGLATPAMFNAVSASTPTNSQLGIGNTYTNVTPTQIEWVVGGVPVGFVEVIAGTPKWTQYGLIDPEATAYTKAPLARIQSISGALFSSTLWIDSVTNHLMRGSVDIETLGGTASSISITPIVGMTATNVQDAIQELFTMFNDAFSQPI